MNENQRRVKESQFLTAEAKAVYLKDRQRYLEEKEVKDIEEIKKILSTVPKTHVFVLK